MEMTAARVEDRRVVETGCTDLDHVRRAKRLLAILVDRFGVAHFLTAPPPGAKSRVSSIACEDAIALACAWIERRTGRVVGDDVVRLMRKDLRRLLVQRIGEGAACTR